jgi:hypothetical protein
MVTRMGTGLVNVTGAQAPMTRNGELGSWGVGEFGIVKVRGCFGNQVADDGVREVFRFSGAAAGSTRLNDTDEIGERKLEE